jgi:hypothetical protein
MPGRPVIDRRSWHSCTHRCCKENPPQPVYVTLSRVTRYGAGLQLGEHLGPGAVVLPGPEQAAAGLPGRPAV